ncbi:MAG: hypothetical protein ACW972_08185 [Promethearchaeota archaeon]|jgi:WD40 repeat protein
MESPLNPNTNDELTIVRKSFQCDLNNNTLRECILSEFNDGNVRLFIRNPQNLINDEILNCLNTGIVSCLQNLHLKRNDFSSVGQVTVSLSKDNLWDIEGIDVLVNLNVKDKELMKFINSCLKFFRESCKLPESVNFFASNKYEVDNLQNYKTEIETLVNKLHEINTKKKDKIKLHNIFKVL